MDDIETLALDVLTELADKLVTMLLVEKSISESAKEQITSSFRKKDWAEKKKRAEEVISILETSKTEEEILQRVGQL